MKLQKKLKQKAKQKNRPRKHILKDEDTIIIQDDAYGQLYFDEKYKMPYIGVNDVNKNIYLGSLALC